MSIYCICLLPTTLTPSNFDPQASDNYLSQSAYDKTYRKKLSTPPRVTRHTHPPNLGLRNVPTSSQMPYGPYVAEASGISSQRSLLHFGEFTLHPRLKLTNLRTRFKAGIFDWFHCSSMTLGE